MSTQGLDKLLVKPRLKPRTDSTVAGFKLKEKKWRAKVGVTVDWDIASLG